MREKIKQYKETTFGYANQLRDVRVAGLLVFAIIVLMISWSGVKTIDTNYKLQKQISKLEQENQVQQLTNKNLQLQNQYLNTNQYLELAARQSFGLAAPGETELIVPQEIALAHTVELPNAEQALAAKTKAKQPLYQRNFQAWMDFFLHRQNTQD
ncbi:MAG TPA: septum formation initiator family protein [Nevskiaceae bacterium]|nr:septum formation initiator family protein [Nevskiaceae bacterium]